MKTLLIILGLFAGQAQAAEIIASVKYHPGFVRFPVLNTIQIESDGTVLRTVKNLRSREETTTLVANINVELIKKLQSRIDSIEKVELTDLQEGEPRCTDAPSSRYQVFSTSGEQISIAARASCHDFVFKSEDYDDEYYAARIKELLDSFTTLSRL